MKDLTAKTPRRQGRQIQSSFRIQNSAFRISLASWRLGVPFILILFFAAPRGKAQDLTAEKRIDNLISQMTLEEKISLVHADTKFTVAGVPRLGIPPLHLSDGPHGVREEINANDWRAAGRTDDYVTWLPCVEGLAATWNPQMAESFGKVIGQEAVSRGKNIMLSPGVNIQRTPLGGRNFEFAGEDPYLASRVAVGFVRGMQAQGVASCVKHFAANNQEENRNSIDVEMDERTLREIYLPAFRAAVQEGGALTVMGAYNKLRGEYCCENDYLLKTILKGEWGFKGLVMSDWAAVHDTVKTANNGLDLEMGSNLPFDRFYFARPLLEAVQQGQIPVSVIDDKVRRHLRVMMALHMLDAGYKPPVMQANTAAHQAIARRVAEEGIVLLKNDGSLLPLDAGKLSSVAVIGQNAVRRFAHSGGSAAIKALYEITPLEGIIDRAGSRMSVNFAMGYMQRTPDNGPNAALIAEAVKAAGESDAVILVAGLNHDANFDTEGSDRKSMALPFGQDELIRRVVAANPKTVVVLVSGGAVEMDGWLDKTPAVVQAFYPGMEGGHALAAILFGDVNPSGKLPCTFPRRLADSPAHALGAYPGKDGVETYAEGLLVGYRWFDAKEIAPLFPFGHGLSYTKFEYSNLKLVEGSGAVVTAQFDIANAGSRDGEEVAELYVSQEHPRLPRPPKELKGFAKVLVRAGESRTLQIPLELPAFSYYDPSAGGAGGWVADKDSFDILIGSSSRDIRLRGKYDLTNQN
jgi:beta-glucosidase